MSFKDVITHELPREPYVTQVFQSGPILAIQYGTVVGGGRIGTSLAEEDESYVIESLAGRTVLSRRGAEAMIVALSTLMQAYDQEQAKDAGGK